MSSSDVLKSGELLKLHSGRLLSKFSTKWKAKQVEIRSDGSISYRDPSDEASECTVAALLPGGSLSLHPGELVNALLALPDRDACAAIFAIPVAGKDDDPARQLVFVARNEESMTEWKAAAATGTGAPSSAPPCGPDVSAAARALNFRARAETLQKAKDAAGPGASPQSVLRELRVPDALRVMLRANASGKYKLETEVVAQLLRIEEDEAAARVAAADGDGCDAAVLRELLCAEENSALAPEMASMGDMGRPMCDYFVCSSHNTYLTGDQVMSSSEAEMYRAVLELGVRCLELDLWDGEDGPVITHGNTATSKLDLKLALKAIAHFAFATTEYPLILSLENHLSLPNQVIAAKMIKDSFRDTLHVVRLSADEELPSPEALKGKVLVKAKMGEWAHSSPDSEDSFDEEDINSADDAKGNEGNSAGDETTPRSFSSLLRRKPSKKKSGSAKKHLPIARELADVTSFGGANRKKLLALWEEGKLHPEGQLASDIVSINESKVEGVYDDGKAESLRAYNSRNMTRIYPKASRVDSSNYNPMPAWAAGCQIVAMNYQSQDVGAWLNHGRFMLSQRCGYALKPAFRKGLITGAGTLTIAVVCGSLLPRSPTSRRGARDFADPYVQLTLARMNAEGKPKLTSNHTASVKCNGLCPSWGETFSFAVADAGTDMLLACVWDDDTASKDDLIGFFSAPVGALREGTRSMQLTAPDGAPLAIPGTSERPSVVVTVAWLPGASASA